MLFVLGWLAALTVARRVWLFSAVPARPGGVPCHFSAFALDARGSRFTVPPVWWVCLFGYLSPWLCLVRFLPGLVWVSSRVPEVANHPPVVSKHARRSGVDGVLLC